MFNVRNFYNVCKVRRKKMHSLVIEPLNIFAHHSNCYSLERRYKLETLTRDGLIDTKLQKCASVAIFHVTCCLAKNFATMPKIIASLLKPSSCPWSFLIPSENIRKPHKMVKHTLTTRRQFPEIGIPILDISFKKLVIALF